jgi:hypothetical protein
VIDPIALRDLVRRGVVAGDRDEVADCVLVLELIVIDAVVVAVDLALLDPGDLQRASRMTSG